MHPKSKFPRRFVSWALINGRPPSWTCSSLIEITKLGGKKVTLCPGIISENLIFQYESGREHMTIYSWWASNTYNSCSHELTWSVGSTYCYSWRCRSAPNGRRHVPNFLWRFQSASHHPLQSWFHCWRICHFGTRRPLAVAYLRKHQSHLDTHPHSPSCH